MNSVNVLAVMDRHIESCRKAGIAEVGQFAELIESRASVFELIAKAEKAANHVRPTCSELYDELTAAIGACKKVQAE